MGILDSKVAAVTGGGRGIGRAVAEAMAAQGAAVVVNDLDVTVSSTKESSTPADEVVNAINSTGGCAASNAMDIATREGGEGLVGQAVKEFGRLDILINAAGILRDRMIFETSRMIGTVSSACILEGTTAPCVLPRPICANAAMVA